jgi:hypothetical protein
VGTKRENSMKHYKERFRWNTETCPSHFKKGEGKREDNGGDEPNWDSLYTYMEMSQQNPLYNYYKLIKTFLKKKDFRLVEWLKW